MNKLTISACIVGLTVGGSFLYAQCGQVFAPTYTPITYNPVIVKEVITPIAVPVLVPTFTFQYAPPCAALAPPVAAMPGMPPLPGQAQQAQAPPPPAQTQPQPPDIKELAKAIIAEMQRQNPQPEQEDDSLPMAQGPLVPTSAPQRDIPLPKKESSLPPGVSPSPKQSTLSREQAAPQAIAALQRNCAACHTGVSAKGEFLLFTQPNVLNSETSWRSILREINSGHMPPRSSQYRLTSTETQAINAWLRGF